MKHILLTLLASFISALLAVAIYSAFQPTPQAAPATALAVRQPDWAPSVSYTPPRQPDGSPSAMPVSFTAAAALATPAVVNIRALPRRAFDFFGSYGGATGSGVIVSSDGYIVTNHHVVEEGPRNIQVTLADQREYKGELVGTDPTTDLALIRIEVDEPLPFVGFANSDSVLVGEWVLAVGNPFNLESTVTAGIVSAKGRNIDILEGEYKIESFIQTDAAVNPGNSGGALVNTSGELIGVNTAIITRSGRYEGYSFAVPANLVRKVVADLREFGSVKRAILGVRISEVTAPMARRLKLAAPEGVLIQDVNPGGAAEMAGLRANDVITAINGQPVRGIPELQEFVARYRPGNVVTISFYRSGAPREVQAVLKGLDSGGAYGFNEAGLPADLVVDNQLGWEYRNLSPRERERLGLRGGVIVDVVDPDGALAISRMEKGFIIQSVHKIRPGSDDDVVKLDTRIVQSVEDLQNAMADFRSEKILLEGRYEGYASEWGYTLWLD